MKSVATVCFLALAALILPSLGRTTQSSSDTVRLNGTDPEQLAESLQQVRRGTFVTVKLLNGSVMPGLFQSYDDYYEKLWLVPKGDAGVFQSRSVRLSSIESVEVSRRPPGVQRARAWGGDE
jgi:hypothetical protein